MEHQNTLNQAYAKLSHCVDHGVGCWLSADMVKALYFSEVGEKFKMVREAEHTPVLIANQ